MIKILFFIDTLQGGGAAKVLRDLVNAMDQTRFAITVQTLYPEEAGKQLAPGIRYRYCYRRNDRLHRLLMRAESEWGRVWRARISDAYDVECAYLESLPTKIMAASSNTAGLKCAWVHCDMAKMAENSPAYVKKTRPWYERFDRIVCVSKTAQASFERLYGQSISTSVIYNSIDDASIRRKAALPLSGVARDGRKTLVSVGTLYPPKNHLRLLRAVKRLVADGLDVALWILGDGPDRPKLEQYIDENGLRKRVTLSGFCRNPYPYILNADLAVCSSLYEGFSTFITEGLILGKPIVTTDVSGMRELLGDSVYGLITDNDDEAFYQGLRRMLTEPGLMAHYAQQARLRGQDFRRETLVRETEDFLERLLAEKQQRSCE